MKRKVRIGTFLICTLISICMLCGCNSKRALVGNWIANEIIKGYPDSMTLKSDGTGVADGLNCSWYTENDRIFISTPIVSLNYKYEVSGSELKLDEHTYSKR